MRRSQKSSQRIFFLLSLLVVLSMICGTLLVLLDRPAPEPTAVVVPTARPTQPVAPVASPTPTAERPSAGTLQPPAIAPTATPTAR